jgi:hypothetical protein
MTLYTDTPERFERALDALSAGIKIEATKSENLTPLILDRINA